MLLLTSLIARAGARLVATSADDARDLCFELAQCETWVGSLIRHRDSNVSGALDEVLRTQGIRTIPTPIGSSKAEALTERCVKFFRREALNWLPIPGRHPDRVLAGYACHDNAQRSHHGIELRVPSSPSHTDPATIVPEIGWRDLLGGVIHEYHRGAA